MLENFKLFVKANPKLIDYVKNGGSWQELYEVYSLYGEDSSAWEKYLSNHNNSIDELVGLIRKVNLESVKNTVDGLQKAVGILQSLGNKDNNIQEEYEKTRKYEDLDD